MAFALLFIAEIYEQIIPTDITTRLQQKVRLCQEEALARSIR
jgi:hypothetical protein